ncbi:MULTISPECIES: type II toxin-antitoxin system RelE/ParE family toxin [Variovorax]|uniref:type II toxin-antitoxin system RelE/ParE family toxin n=1 Tax=Variovorax TaxID=34072 RepID=UPI0012E69B52|nr:type II toxin-antitoxin system RelE/ParE family toxin [Variovorax boronicumulans]GER15346.1 cytoplasmic protein [Variovorax boronicumulans]
MDEKEIRWVGSSYADLLAFPVEPRRAAGFELGKVQAGLDPTDWKPFNDVGAGTREIRLRDASGIYRVMYVAKFEEAVYVLHCFQKKTQATSPQDKAIAQARYRAVIHARKDTP